MSIPFRDQTINEHIGFAGFLRFVDEKDNKGIRAALFCVGSQGEPVDFTYCRVDRPAFFLWREADARRQAVSALVKALFQAAQRVPDLLLALAEEVPLKVFNEDIEVQVALCRVGPTGLDIQTGSSPHERIGETINLYWAGSKPPSGSPARRLLEALHDRGLMMEPFERAVRGLDEVFNQP